MTGIINQWLCRSGKPAGLFAFYAIESTPKIVQYFHFVALMIMHFGGMNKTQMKKSFDGGE